MTGSRIAVTDRDKKILSEVLRLGVLTREQVIRLQLFGSKTRANERLRRLTASGYLAVRTQPIAVGGPRIVYLPGEELKAAVSSRRLRDCSDLFLAHELGLVDIRIAFEQHYRLARWLTAAELSASALGTVPDGYAEYEVEGLTYCAFIEYDRGTETLHRFERKARSYVELAYSGKFSRTFGRQRFRTLIVTDTSGRLATLSATVAAVTNKIFRLTTKTELCARGPVAEIWRRPGKTEIESLTAA